MADQYGHSFADDNAGYADLTLVMTPAVQTAVILEIDKFKALIPDLSASTNVVPDFDQIPPHTAEKLRAEIVLLVAAVEAAPTS